MNTVKQAFRRMAEMMRECYFNNCQDNGATTKESIEYWLASSERREMRKLYRVILKA